MKNIFSLYSKLLAIGFVLTSAPSGWSASIVTWGPSSSYVGVNTNATGLIGGVVPFSDTVARNPGPLYPNGQLSGTYYGGASSEAASGVLAWRVLNGSTGANDALNFVSQSLTNGQSITGVFVWNQTDFLNDLNTGSLELTDFSASLSIAGSSTTGSARWLIEAGGNYYLSSSFTLSSTRMTYELADPSSSLWYNYDPGTSLKTVGTQWMSPIFTDITAVGVWMQSKYVGGTSATSEGRLYGFEAGALAVPEPGTTGLMVLGCLVGFVILRRNSMILRRNSIVH